MALFSTGREVIDDDDDDFAGKHHPGSSIHVYLHYFILLTYKSCKKNVNVICLPREHQGVHKNSLRNVRAFQIELEFGNVGF